MTDEQTPPDPTADPAVNPGTSDPGDGSGPITSRFTLFFEGGPMDGQGFTMDPASAPLELNVNGTIYRRESVDDTSYSPAE